MDIKTMINLAKQNKREAVNNMKIGYSTELKGPKKMEKTVNPRAVKALLNRKKEIEKIQFDEQLKKKHELQNLREEKRHTKKAKAMANRTKDNLMIYRGDDGKKEERDFPLSPEAEKHHKAFMNKIMDKSGQTNYHLDEGGGNSPPQRNNSRKLEKSQEKSRKASSLNFNDLLNLAQEQAGKNTDESSSSDSGDSSDEDLDAGARYEKERRKRKELEAQLKAMKSSKRKSENSKDAPAFKIGKLDKGLSEESKKAKVKALMATFSKKSKGETLVNGTSKKETSLDRRKESHKNNVDNRKKANVPLNSSVERRKEMERRRKSASPLNKKETIRNNSPLSLNGKKGSNQTKTNLTLDRRKPDQPRERSSNPYKDLQSKSKQSNPDKNNVNPDRRNNLPNKNGLSAKTKQSNIKEHFAKPQGKLKQVVEKNAKKAPNPYTVIMEKAKVNATNNKACTLSVKSACIRTNYPGVSQTDPRNPAYRKSSASPSALAMEEYRRRRTAAQGRPDIQRRTQVLDDYDDEDEYDSEMEGFIDDEDNGLGHSISAQIGAIFGYDKSKYGRESEYELSKMDASFKDIEREEKRSLRIAQQEDAQEARLEEERKKKLEKKRK